MRLKIYVNVDGLEQLALGQELWPWHFAVQTGQYDTAPTGAVFLGEVDYALPSAEACIVPVLAKLAQRQSEIQAEAHEELLKLNERKQKLLSLSYSPATEVPHAS